MNDEQLARKIIGARRPEDIFGADSAELKDRFQRAARRVHPDSHGGEKLYQSAMGRLISLRDEADVRIAAGTYGKTDAPTVTIRTKSAEYVLASKIAAGDLCDVYNTVDGCHVIKIGKSASDADLLRNEQSALRELNESVDCSTGKVNGTHAAGYWTRCIDSVGVQVGKMVLPVNVLEKYPGPCFTLEEVERAFPRGLDMADASWMLRRLLEGLHWAHKQGRVHGAILPSNLMILPDSHGLHILDWCYSVKAGAPLRAAVASQKLLYAPEVWRKEPATPALDIYMAAATFKRLCKVNVPRKIRGLLNACTIENPGARIGQAIEAYEQLGLHLLEEYGPPKFRPFRMPPVS